MLFDGIQVLNGSNIQNIQLNGGTSLPASGASGEMFYKTDENRVYIYGGGTWSLVANAGTLAGAISIYDIAPSIVSANGKFLTTDGTTISWANVPTPSVTSLLPSQTNNAGKFLTTDGTSISWATITIPTLNSLLPTQTSNAGKYLTTDGTNAAWTSFSITNQQVLTALTYTPVNKAGDTITGPVAINGTYTEASLTQSISTATANINCATSNIFYLTLQASTTLSFVNVPSGTFTLTLVCAQDATGSRLITWPGSVKWPGGSAPTLTTTGSKTDVISLLTSDGGTTWLGFPAGINF